MSIPRRPDNVLLAMSSGRAVGHHDLEPLVPSPDGAHDFPPEILSMLEQLEKGGFVERVGELWKLTPEGVKRKAEITPPPETYPMARRR